MIICMLSLYDVGPTLMVSLHEIIVIKFIFSKLTKAEKGYIKPFLVKLQKEKRKNPMSFEKRVHE